MRDSGNRRLTHIAPAVCRLCEDRVARQRSGAETVAQAGATRVVVTVADRLGCP